MRDGVKAYITPKIPCLSFDYRCFSAKQINHWAVQLCTFLFLPVNVLPAGFLLITNSNDFRRNVAFNSSNLLCMNRSKYQLAILLIAIIAVIVLLGIEINTIINAPDKSSEHIGYPF